MDGARPHIMNTQPKTTKLISIGRHRRNCNVFAQKNREEIAREFVDWTGAKAIAKEFGFVVAWLVPSI